MPPKKMALDGLNTWLSWCLSIVRVDCRVSAEAVALSHKAEEVRRARAIDIPRGPTQGRFCALPLSSFGLVVSLNISAPKNLSRQKFVLVWFLV